MFKSTEHFNESLPEPTDNTPGTTISGPSQNDSFEIAFIHLELRRDY